jgi:hypothetical protein
MIFFNSSIEEHLDTLQSNNIHKWFLIYYLGLEIIN